MLDDNMQKLHLTAEFDSLLRVENMEDIQIINYVK